MPALPDADAWRRLAEARVAYLATVRADGRPHVVPIVLALDGTRAYSITDPKPKDGLDLQRHRNIAVNPAVSLLVDRYDESWETIWWVRADGRARVAEDGPDRARAIELLRAKYPQYATWSTPFGPATIIEIDRITSWTM